jgi:hypothetical protein
MANDLIDRSSDPTISHEPTTDGFACGLVGAVGDDLVAMLLQGAEPFAVFVGTGRRAVTHFNVDPQSVGHPLYLTVPQPPELRREMAIPVGLVHSDHNGMFSPAPPMSLRRAQ